MEPHKHHTFSPRFSVFLTHCTVVIGIVFVGACGESDSATSLVSHDPTAPPAYESTSAEHSTSSAIVDRLAQQRARGHGFENANGRAFAVNLAHEIVATVDATAVMHVAPRASVVDEGVMWNTSLRLESIGRNGDLVAVPDVASGPQVTDGTARIVRMDGLEEWFSDGLLGVEHGFVLTQPPSAASAWMPGVPESPIVAQISVTGSLRPATTSRPDVLSLQDESGRSVLFYGGLHAQDAHGIEIPAWLELHDASILLKMDDRDAHYPLTIDPLVWVYDQKIEQGGPGCMYDQLGLSVAVSGDTLIAGAFGNDEKGVDAGAAYIYTKTGSTWVQTQKLMASDATAGDYFGYSVSMSADVAIVGAFGNDQAGVDAGAAYVFVRSAGGWIENKKLTPNSLHAKDFFGASVAVQGATAIVGAYGDDAADGTTLSGAAYVFGKDVGGSNAWGEQARLTAPTSGNQDQFGIAVAVDADTVVVGANGDGENGSIAGAGYVYVRSGSNWSQQGKLIAADGSALDKLGSTVSIQGDTVVLGAPFANSPQENAGAAYVFTRSNSTWTQQQKLVQSGPAAREYFGSALSLQDNRVAIGAWGSAVSASNAGAAYVFQRTGTTWTQQSRFQSDEITANNFFGIGVALEQSTMVIGATGRGDGGTQAGAVYVFGQNPTDPTAWDQNSKLLALDGLAGEYLGYAIALDGTTAIGGTYHANDLGVETGAAYIFTHGVSGWKQQARLTASDAKAGDRFGFAVDVDGNTAVVGAYTKAGTALEEGAAYVYVRSGTTWTEQAKLIGDDPFSSEQFGVAVDVHGDTIAVGSHQDRVKGANSGSVYLFNRSGTTWNQTTKLTASDGASGNRFGRALALQGDSLLVGAYQNNSGASNSGSAYVFLRTGSTWAQSAKLANPTPVANANFGLSVALDGDIAVAGAYRDTVVATDAGSASVFVRSGNTWTHEATLKASNGAEGDYYGRAVAVRGNRIVVGAYHADPKGSDSGAAYAYERTGTTWTETQILTAHDAAASDYYGFAVALGETTALIGSYGDDDKGSASGSIYAVTLRQSLGDACGNSEQCETGNCVDGVCCKSLACPDCYSCAAAGSKGQCVAMPSLEGSACGNPANNDCTKPDTCDSEGVCQPNHVAELAPCGNGEPSECVEPGTCDGAGTCLETKVPEGTACGDLRQTECTMPDSCNAEGICSPNDMPDGTQCGNGVCGAGICGGNGTGDAGDDGGSGFSPSDAESGSDDGGCGCRTAGRSAQGGGIATLLLLAATARLCARSRRNSASNTLQRAHKGRFSSTHRSVHSSISRSVLLAACTVIPFCLSAGCGSSSGSSDSERDGFGGSSGNDGGDDRDGGKGGTGQAGHPGSGAFGGGPACEPSRVCGTQCCSNSQECENNRCVAVCEGSRERCGEPSVCCAEGEHCFKNKCDNTCASPTFPCGYSETLCCNEGNVCFNNQCVVPGSPCVDYSNCNEDEICDPTLELCISKDSLPLCEYHPPTGKFQPKREWTYSPVTAPYARSTVAGPVSDICSAGFPLAFSDPDEALVVVPIGELKIPFFDKERVAITVSTNGWLTFDDAYSGGPAPSNTALLDSKAPNLVVAPYWDNLTHVTACALVDSSEGKVTVQWHGEVGTTGEWLRFQAVLYATTHANAGRIEIKYLDVGATHDGDGATIGIAEKATERAVQHGFNRNGAVSNNTTLRYDYVPLHNRFDVVTVPVIFDVNGDGKPEVIFPAYDETSTGSGAPNDPINDLHSGVLTILNGEDGTIQSRPIETAGYEGYLASGIALSVGDIDGDGVVDIVGVGQMDPMSATEFLRIKAFNADGSIKWISNENVGFNYNGWGGGVTIADLDNDGHPEIIYALSVFSHDGHLLWSKTREYAHEAVTAADLDGDGKLEVISSYSAYHHDGTQLWRRADLSAYRFPSIADFDLDGKPEVVLVRNGQVIILNGQDGSTFWGPVSIQTTGAGSPVIGDFDGDGFPEIGIAGEGLYVVIDLQCKGAPLPKDCDREWVRWSVPTKDISSNVTGSSLFDFEGDGKAEVVYSDECFTRVYSGTNGQVLFETSVNTRTATEYPLVADVNGDNKAEIVVVANESVQGCNAAPWSIGMMGNVWKPATYPPPYCTSSLCAHRGISVYSDALDNWVRTRPVWNGHAYHITNVLPNGAIPHNEEPNWKNPRYNNFRMNAQGDAPFSAPDLLVELTMDDIVCPARLRLRANVMNHGALGVSSGVNVAFYKQVDSSWVCLGVVQTAKAVVPGGETEVVLDYELEPTETNRKIEFRAVVDSDCDGVAKHNECEDGGEDNNEDTLTGICAFTGPS